MKKSAIFVVLICCLILGLYFNLSFAEWQIIPTKEAITLEEAKQYVDELNKFHISSSSWRFPKNTECIADKDIITKLENFEYNTEYWIKLYYTENDEITEIGEWDFTTITFFNPIPNPLYVDGIGYSISPSTGKLLIVSDPLNLPSDSSSNSNKKYGCFIQSLFHL